MTTENEYPDLDYNPTIIEPNDSFDDRIASILEQIHDEDSIKISLFKKSKFGKFAVCDSLDCEQIDYHEIGTKHGKGDFRLYVKWKKPNEKIWHTRNYNFSVDDYYEKVKTQNEEKERQNMMPQNNSGTEILPLIIQMMQMNQQAMQEANRQQNAQMLAMFGMMMNNKPSNDNSALLAYIMDDKREDRKFSNEIFLKGLEMGTQQQQLDAESNQTSWKDVACTIIENADKILTPFLSGMIKSEMKKPEYADLLGNGEFMEFVKNGVNETHPEKAEQILKEFDKLQG